MQTQVIFKIDKKKKEEAMRKAKKEGLTYSAVLKSATDAFINGDIKVGLIAKEIQEIEDDIKKGKNMSPTFSSAKEANEYLDNL